MVTALTHELVIDIGAIPILVRTDSREFAHILEDRYGKFVSADAPQAVMELEIELIPPGLAVQPNHAAAGPDLAAAGQLISQVAHGAEQAAAAGLSALADLLPAGATCAVAVVVKAVSVPDRLQDVLRSHA